MDCCPVCGAPGCRAISTPRRSFFRCPSCSFVRAAPGSRPSPEAARERYVLHRNSRDDKGYVEFLSRIVDRVAGTCGPGLSRVLDWGSGPTPVCSELLRDRGYRVDSWDPHFAPGALPPEGAFDAVLCVEVAEHFDDPRSDFFSMAARLRPGGFLFVHTSVVPEEDADFLRWWYQEDPTHVSFYSAASFRVLASWASLEPLFADGPLAAFRKPRPVLVAGGSNWDAEGRPFASLVRADSNPGTVRFSAGGAGRNVAEDLARMGAAAELLSVVGDDGPGREIAERTAAAGVGVAGLVRRAGEATSCYLSILDADGDMALALSGMGLYDLFGPPEVLACAEEAEAEARERCFLKEGDTPFSALVVDGNLRPDAARALLDRFPSVPAWFDPVSTTKAARFASFADGDLLRRFRGMKPNLVEAEAMCAALGSPPPGDGASDLDRARAASRVLRGRGADAIYVSMGASGVFWLEGSSEGPSFGRFVPPPVEIGSATGAGDAFLASAVRAAALGLSGRDLVLRASAAAAIVLSSPEASSADLCAANIESSALDWSRT